MKVRIITIAIGLSLAVVAARANDILTVSEVGENFSDITATLNGSPVSILLTGAPDNWTIEFPAGFALNLVNSGPGIQLGEPEDPALYNNIFITQPTFMLWTSDIPAPAGVVLQNPITISNAGTGPSGMPLDLVLSDAVPEPSTLSLFGMGLVGLACFVRMRRATV